MGRIKTIPIKRATHKLIEKYGDRFTSNYEKNKEILKSLVSSPSKKLINCIAGYVTRITRKGAEAKKAKAPSEEAPEIPIEG